ncbi:MAG: type II toxin-antitoxin system HipA family toxin, partial [Gemmatimonadota bacterium]|nr:type II toxin-antitoxin system HipA family toxin [Gemmatimonadota bacterium]
MPASNPTTRKRRTPAVNVLEVLLGNDLVGTLTHLPDDRTIWGLDPAYAENAARPTLSLSFKTASGGVTADTRPTRLKVPPYFSNLLPEGHLREYLADRGAVHPEREFFLLWLLGEDLPGAVRIRPLIGDALPPTAAAAAGADPQIADQLLRFSLAGVQLKFSALIEADGGLTIPLHGVGGDWIAKFPSAWYTAVPENEYVMLTLAGAAGVSVPELRLVPIADIHNVPAGAFSGGGQALVVRRFDRGADGARIHMEDFAQVFDLYPNRKYGKASYEDIARVLLAETGEAGIREFIRRLAVTALIGNGDMHLKNWSLIYPDRRTPVLSPAYDFVSTITYEFEPELALSLGGTKAMEEVDEALFRR